MLSIGSILDRYTILVGRARPPQPPAGCVVLNQVTLKYPDGHNGTSCYASHFVERGAKYFLFVISESDSDLVDSG